MNSYFEFLKQNLDLFKFKLLVKLKTATYKKCDKIILTYCIRKR